MKYTRYTDTRQSSFMPRWLKKSRSEDSIRPSIKGQYIKFHHEGDNCHLANFHGLAETYKDNISFRPIISACGASTRHYSDS